MESSISKILVGSVVKKTLQDMKEDPNRGIRNLVDMALQFSDGRFQGDFFTTVQTMLQNENSAYYQLVREVVTHADTNRIYTFGMNLGYNGCTIGAQRIRENEKNLNCSIPWTVLIQIRKDDFEKKEPKYQAAVGSGEKLGIYSWMLFCESQPECVFPLVKAHPDSAFFLFCEPEGLTSEFLDEAIESNNLMLAIRFDEETGELCSKLRDLGLLYSVWAPYGQKDLESIANGDLFYSVQQLSPIFTALLPERNCPDVIQQLVCQTVQQARKEQSYHTMLWELSGDNRLVDTIISGDACSVYFDADGNINDRNGQIRCMHRNLFESSLKDIFVDACPKEVRLPLLPPWNSFPDRLPPPRLE